MLAWRPDCRRDAVSAADPIDGATREAELNIQAIVQRTHQIEDLEAPASHLVAFTDYILDEFREGRELGRYIEPDALWTVACELLAERYPRILALQEVVWVFLATSERWEHACEHLEPQIFLIA